MNNDRRFLERARREILEANGDIDPRDDPRLCQMVSDKALSIGGGVLEAILSRPEVRVALLG